MPILVTCRCGKRLQAKPEHAGKKIRCPGCQAVLDVREAEADVLEAAAVAAAPRPVAGHPRKPTAARRQPEAEAAEPRPRRPAQTLAPRRQIVLRIIVLVLAILDGGLAGVLGFKAYLNTHDARQIASIELSRAFLKEIDGKSPGDAKFDEVRSEVSRFDRLGVGCYFLLAGSLFGLVGGVLALLRRGKIAAPLLILPSIGATVIMPVTGILTWPLILSGLLALLIRSAPRRTPDSDEEQAAQASQSMRPSIS